MDLKSLIRDVKDFPEPGIVFKDITPLLRHKEAFAYALEEMARPYRSSGVDFVLAVESRGFFLGAPIAHQLNCGFVPIRKKGKLPWKTVSAAYTLEYGEAVVEMHSDALEPGSKVLLVDDVLATGGTLSACCELVARQKGEVVGMAVLVELKFLKGREKLSFPLHTLVQYDEPEH